MTSARIRDLRRLAGMLPVALLVALLALSACDTVSGGRSDYATQPGIRFHNDIVVFGAIGGGSGSR